MKKKIIVSIMTIIILLGICGVTKAASTSISATNTSPTVGANVTITVRFSQPVTTADFRFNYDSSKLQYVSNSIGGTNMGSYVKVDYIDLDLKTISSVSFTFKAKTAGTANCSISNIVASDANANVLNTSASSININVKNKASTNNNNNNNNNNNTNSSGSNNNNSSSKKPTFTSVNQKVYAKENVSIRDSWSTSGKLLGTLQKDSSITRTGIGSNGWDRVTYNGRTAYISHTYLTTTKPKDDKDDKKDDDKNNTTNEENNQANEVDNNAVNNVTANNETNDITNNETNEATNTQTPGKKEEKKGFNVNTIEMIIIGVIILAIIVIIVNEIVAKKRREARRKEEKRVKGSRR